MHSLNKIKKTFFIKPSNGLHSNSISLVCLKIIKKQKLN